MPKLRRMEDIVVGTCILIFLAAIPVGFILQLAGIKGAFDYGMAVSLVSFLISFMLAIRRRVIGQR